jgi:hypothetical protein
MIQDMGLGMGTFLKCDNYAVKEGGAVQVDDNSIIQIGASSFALVNVVSRSEYDKMDQTAKSSYNFSFRNECGSKLSATETFTRKLND